MKTLYSSAAYCHSNTSENEDLPATIELERMEDEGGRTDISDRFSALEKIKDMWDNFDLDEYMRTQSSYPRNDQLNNTQPNVSYTDTLPTQSPSWRHRVTVPQPFDMTIRDEFFTKRKEEKLQAMRKEKVERERMAEAELKSKRQFRANPVPAHVYLPLYDELTQTQEQRRQFVVEHSQQLLRSMQKPFKFTIRNNASRSLQRCASATELGNGDMNTNFKANPVPPSTNDPNILEKMRERDIYRKIQARMRAIELYRSAAAPPSMEARRMAQQEILTETLKSRVSSADRAEPIPDPDYIDRLSKPRSGRPPIARTRSRFIPPDADELDKELDYEMPTNTRPRSAAESLAAAKRVCRTETAPPQKLTQSCELRSLHTQRKLAAERERFEREQQLQEQHEMQRRHMIKHVKERALSQKPRSEEERVEKQRERHSDLCKQGEQYRHFLADVEQKLDSRPLLAERIAAEAARKQAAIRYREALEKVGLTEDEVLHSTTVGGGYDLEEPVDHGHQHEHHRRRHHHYHHQPRHHHGHNHDHDSPEIHERHLSFDIPPDHQPSPIEAHSPADDYAF